MGFLIGEIFFFLVAAAVLGGILGWVLRGSIRNRPVRSDARRHPSIQTTPDPQRAPQAPRRVHGQTDDLKRIHGIGPKLERVLNELGITTYAQIARLSESEIPQLADGIGSFPDRIHRDDWIGGARREYMVKYGRPIQ